MRGEVDVAKGSGSDGELAPVDVVEGGEGAVFDGVGGEDAVGAATLQEEAAALLFVEDWGLVDVVDVVVCGCC